MLERIRYFHEVVRQKSFSKAAEVCHLSQSAISQQVAALERELGIELLVRSHRSFHLSEAGEYFYRNTQQLLEDTDRILRETRQIAAPEESVLRLGILFGAEKLCIKSIAEFKEQLPQVRLEISFGSHETLFQQLRADALDLVINDQRRAFSESYHNDILLRRFWRVDCNQKTPEAVVDARSINHVGCILLDDQLSEQEYCKDVLGLNGPFLLAPNEEAAHLLVLAGKGIYPCTENASLPVLRKEGQALLQTLCAFSKAWNTKDCLMTFLALLHKNIEYMEAKS